MKTIYRISLTFFGFVCFFLLDSCKEQLSPLQDSPNPDKAVIEAPSSVNLVSQMQSLAPELYEPINDTYEDYGKLVYHHYRFNPVNDPIEYMPKEQRATYLAALEKVRKDFAGLSIKQKIGKLRKDGLINDNVQALYTDYFDKLYQEFETNNNPIELWKFLRNSEKQLIARPNDEGIGNLIVVSSMLRNHLKYKWEVETLGNKLNLANMVGGSSPNARLASFCLFGLKGSCWLNAIVDTVFGAATAGLTKGLGNVSDGKADTKFMNGLAAAGWVGAAIVFLKEMYTAYNDSACGCGTPAPPACETPQGFRVLINDCTLTQYFQVMGGGTTANNFHYSVQNGSFPEFGNASSITYTGARMIKVTQNDPNVPILLTATVACSNGQTFGLPAYYNLYTETRNPEPITLSGPVNIDYNDPSNWTYDAYGGNTIANRNNKLVWSRNFAGQTVGGGADDDDHLIVKWVYRTNMGKVYLQSQNQCSGTQVIRELTVNIY